MSGIEILGIAASVVSIADLGAKLSVKLFTFSRKVKHADKSIDSISKQIAFTGSVLQQLGSVLNEHDNAKLCKPEYTASAKSLVEACENIFSELNDAIDGSGKAGTAGGGIVLGLRQRLKFPFLQPQIDLLQAKLESLQSSLQVMLQALVLAVGLKNHEAVPLLQEQRATLETLVREQATMAKRLTQLTDQALDSHEPSQRPSANQVTVMFAQTNGMPRASEEGRLPPNTLTQLPMHLYHHAAEIFEHSRMLTVLMDEIDDARYQVAKNIREASKDVLFIAHYDQWSRRFPGHMGTEEWSKFFADHPKLRGLWDLKHQTWERLDKRRRQKSNRIVPSKGQKELDADARTRAALEEFNEFRRQNQSKHPNSVLLRSSAPDGGAYDKKMTSAQPMTRVEKQISKSIDKHHQAIAINNGKLSNDADAMQADFTPQGCHDHDSEHQKAPRQFTASSTDVLTGPQQPNRSDNELRALGSPLAPVASAEQKAALVSESLQDLVIEEDHHSQDWRLDGEPGPAIVDADDSILTASNENALPDAQAATSSDDVSNIIGSKNKTSSLRPDPTTGKSRDDKNSTSSLRSANPAWKPRGGEQSRASYLSYFASYSQTSTLRNSLTKDSEGDDPDNEDSSRVSHVLRAYYTERGRNFPEWLPPDPKKSALVPALSHGSYVTSQGSLPDLWGRGCSTPSRPHDATVDRTKPPRSAPQNMALETHLPTQGGLVGGASAQERLRARLAGRVTECQPDSTLRPEPLFRKKSRLEQSSTDDIASLLRTWIDLDAKELDLLGA